MSISTPRKIQVGDMIPTGFTVPFLNCQHNCSFKWVAYGLFSEKSWLHFSPSQLPTLASWAKDVSLSNICPLLPTKGLSLEIPGNLALANISDIQIQAKFSRSLLQPVTFIYTGGKEQLLRQVSAVFLSLLSPSLIPAAFLAGLSRPKHPQELELGTVLAGSAKVNPCQPPHRYWRSRWGKNSPVPGNHYSALN